MRKIELDAILGAMLQSYEGISDFLFTVGRPLQVEAYGRLKSINVEPPIHSMTSYQTEAIALNIIGHDKRLIDELLRTGSCDCSYSLGDEARFRVNIFKQKGHLSIVMRKLQMDIPTLRGLGLPVIFEEIAREKTGLVLFTGSTGSGKTTSLAAVLNQINETQAVHIVTLEDPIEFVHPHKQSSISQRELGIDFESFTVGLRAALRQAPKVILVGELRDRNTIETAISAAETGHLVLSTLHTIDAGQSINRILGLFDTAEEAHLRQRLADTLRYVVSQRLAPKIGGGRQLLLEIMGNSLRTKEAITLGEHETRDFYSITEASATYGWTTFDQSILRAYEAGIITEETSLLYANRKGAVTRAIDSIKKARGVAQGVESGLRLDLASKLGA
ncbi:MAG TPA: PilT/PilU family type 4a pilus ATPase [Chthoniobacterales bacterium]|jgi:twitching motility protein PilT